MARFDVPTRNVMLHVVPDAPLDLADLNALLAPLGMEVRCYRRREARLAPYQHMDPERCGQRPDEK